MNRKYNLSRNSISYVNQREMGRHSFRDRQFTMDSLLPNRSLRPHVADTSTTCRATYLLHLNCENTLLAAAHGNTSVVIYCPLSGQMLAKCIGHTRPPWTLSFHPTRPYIMASGCLSGSVRLWDLEQLGKTTTRAPVSDISCLRNWEHVGAVSSLSFHPTHPILAVAWTQEVIFYNWKNGNQLSAWRFVSYQSRVRWVRFTNDGSSLYTATTNPQSYTGPSGDIFGIDPVPACREQDTARLTKFAAKYAELPAPPTVLVPRGLLLEFLMSQPDLWFTRLGICDLCSIRICRWAGCLLLRFPPTSTDIRKGLSIGVSTAHLVAGKLRVANLPLTRTVNEFVNATSPSGLVYSCLRDIHPTAVTIIEDKPVREFLLSRGNYCCNPSSPVKRVCCGGHAYDLVLAHRELIRHSVCRSCLAPFWQWVCKSVDWWPLNTNGQASPSPHALDIEMEFRQETNRSPSPTSSTNRSTAPVAGLCVQCQASEAGNDCIPSTSDWHELPLAALELVQARLSNAYEMSPLTHMAPDLVSKGAIENYIRKFFMPRSNKRRSKRRKSSSVQADTPGTSTRPPVVNNQGCDTDNQKPSTSTSSDVYTIGGASNFIEEALALGDIMSAPHMLEWDRPHPAHLIQSPFSSDQPPPKLKFFSYVTLGSKLIHPSVHASLGYKCSSKDILWGNHRLTTACCRCGRIVPRTFSVDPLSKLSSAICKDLVMSENSGRINRGELFATTVGNESAASSEESGSPAQSGVLYLVNQTNNNSVFGAVQRSVTEVITGLLMDMGEHGTAACLRDCTHRVCCWDLRFCDSNHVNAQDKPELYGGLCPKPSNAAVSYNNNSLVVPYIRLFNDSSICISPDGRSLAAFIIPSAYGEPGLIGDDKVPSSSDTLLAIFRLRPKANRGQCLFVHRVDGSSPVCLDFSPLGDYLAVGMATSRIPSFTIPTGTAATTTNNYSPFVQTDLLSEFSPNPPPPPPSESSGSHGSTRHYLVAQIFRVRDKVAQPQTNSDTQANSFSRVLLRTAVIQHPGLLNPVSCSREHMLLDAHCKDMDVLDHWHRMLLSTPTGISLNTILWNPNGGLLYGTTKGLIVLMKPRPASCQPTSDNSDRATISELQ